MAMLTPRQKLEDLVESGDVSSWPSTTPFTDAAEMITALAALYIGDELRKIAQAIANCRPIKPSQQEIAERLELVKQVAEQVLSEVGQALPPSREQQLVDELRRMTALWEANEAEIKEMME